MTERTVEAPLDSYSLKRHSLGHMAERPGEALSSPSISKIAGALAKAQGEMGKAKKSADNPAFRSKYADLEAVVDVCNEVLPTNGIVRIQQSLPVPQGCHGVCVRTTLLHSSGEWISDGGTYVPIKDAKKDDPHAVGSAYTYARRYGLATLVGIAPEDDDGNAAAAQQPQQSAGGTGWG